MNKIYFQDLPEQFQVIQRGNRSVINKTDENDVSALIDASATTA